VKKKGKRKRTKGRLRDEREATENGASFLFFLLIKRGGASI
jgi:hypothetical protein